MTDKNARTENDSQVTPKTTIDAIFNIPQSACIDRRDDPQFCHEIDRLIKEGEELRLTQMKRNQFHKNAGFAAKLVIILCAVCAAGWFLLMDLNVIKAAACLTIAIAMPLAIKQWTDLPLKQYQQRYKDKFMPAFAQLMGGFEYHPSRGISEKVLRASGVMPPSYKSYHSEDCFRGHYKGNKVLLAEATLSDTKKQPVFRGLLLLVELPQKIFSGHTIITANREMADSYAETRWQSLSPLNIYSEQKPSNRLIAFAKAPQEAKTMIGDKLIKELTEADIAFGDAKLSAVFMRGKYVFMAIPNQANMFEACDLHLPINTNEQAAKCRKEIHQLLEVIDIIDLYATGEA